MYYYIQYILRIYIDQNQIWCVDIHEYLAFGSTIGSTYYTSPPRK